MVENPLHFDVAKTSEHMLLIFLSPDGYLRCEIEVLW